jgi:hypothetical protein
VSPGRAGALIYAVLPVLFFLPLEDLALFPDRPRSVLAVLWLMAVALGIVLRAEHGPRDPHGVWLLQKGISLADAAAEDWILDAGLLAVACLWWSVIGALALWVEDFPLGYAPALFAFGFTTSLLTRTLAGLFSAIGARGPADLTAVTAFCSLLVPAVLTGTEPGVQRLGTWLAPPYPAAVALGAAVRAADLAEAAGAALHVLVFLAVLTALTYWRLRRCRPGG